MRFRNWVVAAGQGADPEGANGAIAPPKTYESNFITIIWYNTENNFRDSMRLDYHILLKSPPPRLTVWIRPCAGHSIFCNYSIT